MRLKETRLNLHLARKKVISLILLFFFLSLIINCIIFISTNGIISQLNVLQKSDYESSFISTKGIGQNEYLKFNVGISFLVSPSEDTCLNADIVMQADNAKYSNMVFWNAQLLDKNSVAITKKLAKAYHLVVGSKLYSKHAVDGNFHQYTVKQILPDAMKIRVTKQKSFTDGIIIMGVDEQYVKNITHKYVIYSNKPIENLSKLTGYSMENFLYRMDEILNISEELIPYILVLLTVSILITSFQVFFLTKEISSNAKRLIILGFEKEEFDKDYRKAIIGTGCISLLITVLTSTAILFFFNTSSLGFVFLYITVFIELLTLIFMAEAQRKRLWRE